MKKDIFFLSFFDLRFMGGYEQFVRKAYFLLKDSFNVKACSLNRTYLILILLMRLRFNQLKELIISKKSFNFNTVSLFELKKIKNNSVVYIKNDILDFLMVLFIPKQVKIIVGVHSSFFINSPKLFSHKFHNFIYSSKLYKMLMRKVHSFHVLNDHDSVVLKNFFKIKKKRIFKIENWISNSFLSEQVIKNTKKKDNKFSIFFAGALIPEKGFELFIKVIKKLNNSDYKDQFRFNIVGEGILKNKIPQFDNVVVFGGLPHEDMRDMFLKSDLLFFPSLAETFSLICLESAYCGTPILSRKLHINKLFIPDEYGDLFIFNSSDTSKIIAKLIKIKKLKETNLFLKIKRAFKLKVKKFSENNAIKGFKVLFVS